MKKLVGCLLLLAGLASVCAAGWVYRSSTSVEVGGNEYVFTNVSKVVSSIHAVEMDFGAAVTCTVRVYKVRAAYTNLLKQYTMSNQQYLYANKDEFSGVFFKQNDKI